MVRRQSRKDNVHRPSPRDVEEEIVHFLYNYSEPEKDDDGNLVMGDDGKPNRWNKYQSTLMKEMGHETANWVLDWADLSPDDAEYKQSLFSSDFLSALLAHPDHVFESMNQTLLKHYGSSDESNRVNVRIKNLYKERGAWSRDIKIGEIMPFDEGCMFPFKGRIRRVGLVEQKVTQIIYVCPTCNEEIIVIQDVERGAYLKTPRSCKCGRKGRFIEIESNKIDSMVMVLEDDDEGIAGDIIPSIPVIIEGWLIRPEERVKYGCGKKVIVNGIVRSKPTIRKDTRTNIFTPYLEANFVEFLDEQEIINITDSEIKQMESIVKEGNILNVLGTLAFPEIYGNDAWKEAVILSCIGAETDDPELKLDRKQIHALSIGDPATGKTQIAKRIKEITTKFRKASGGSTSGVGFVGAVVKDPMFNSWVIDPGVLVLSHGGVMFIEEFDKIGEDDTNTLHDAMESGEITITKAGLNATYRAQSTIVAVANPKYGVFSDYEELYKQFNFKPTLINRFDLIVILKDVVDREKDSNIFDTKFSFVDGEQNRRFVKKFIHKARQFKPVFSSNKKAMELAKKLFLDLRGMGKTGSNVPLNMRQLDSFLRICIAIAKMNFSEVVEEVHVKAAFEMLLNTLKGVAIDHETGLLDSAYLSTGMTSSKRNKYHTIREVIARLDKEGGLFTFEQMRDGLKEAQIDVSDSEVEEMIYKLLKEGDLIQPRNGFYKKLE